MLHTYLSPLELRRLAIENVARLHALGEHPYRSIEHALDVRGDLVQKDDMSHACSSIHHDPEKCEVISYRLHTANTIPSGATPPNTSLHLLTLTSPASLVSICAWPSPPERTAI